MSLSVNNKKAYLHLSQYTEGQLPDLINLKRKYYKHIHFPYQKAYFVRKSRMPCFLTYSFLVKIQIQMSQNVDIIVRMRPMLSFQADPSWMIKNNSILALQTHNTSRTNRSLSPNLKAQSIHQSKQLIHEFNFQKVVAQTISSEQLYKQHIKATVLQCFKNRRNLSIMAYGQTCSGKTHTILGTKDVPGINPCILRELFLLKQSRKCSFKFSYIEIYNEKISDLLARKGEQKQLKIKQDQKWGYDIAGSVKETAAAFEEAIKVLERGEKQRQYGNGQHHERSSRSHTLFRIFVEQWDQNLTSNSFLITIVDLAGSEKLVSSKQSHSETGFINKSLFQLTNVIARLSQNSQHIPYRDSKLTRLLEPSLSGNGRAYLICCVSPSSNSYNQTLSTLRLAERARKIQLKNDANESKQEQLQQVKQKLRLKSKQCQQLRRQLQILTQKLQSIEVKQQKLLRQKQKKCDLLILLDHQNFTLFVNDKLIQTEQNMHQIKCLKQDFLLKMQTLYESYTRQIVDICFGDEFQLKIQQICFMNMVLQHEKVEDYKLDIIDHLIKEQEYRQIEQNNRFFVALEGYRHKLLTSRSCSQTSIYRQFPISSQKEHSMSNYSLKSCQKSTAKKIQPVQQSEECCSQILVWGSKKDYRVCKGEAYGLNIVKVSAIKNIKAISCGYHHTLVVTGDGRVYGWGKNTQKQISSSERESLATPVEIEQLRDKIKNIAAGWGHSLALTFAGQIYSWGYGKDGQLGLGTRISNQSLTLIPYDKKVLKIYAGHSHSGFIDCLDDLYTFGFNEDYRLMIGDTKTVLKPKRVPIRDVKEAGLGVSHSALITKNGLLYCGGVGTYGELGVVLNENQSGWQKLQVADKKFSTQNYQQICPIVQVEVFKQKNRPIQVRCGQNTTFVLTENKQVWSFGKNLGGRIGHKKITPQKILEDIDLLEIGCRNGLAYRRKEKKLYSWGFNLYGQTNPGIMGDVQIPQLLQNMNDREILKMSCGFFHSAVCTK